MRPFLLLFGVLSVGGILLGCSREKEAREPLRMTASLETDLTELRALKTIPHVLAEEISGPNGTEFYVTKRLDPATCTACHQAISSLPEGQGDTSARKMHVDIALHHAPSKMMDCRTCHANDPSQLSVGKEVVSMNQVQQVCVQCHFEQVRDWAGGAHGKRLGGWRGKRVIQNCTDCHNPHDPSFKARFPDPGPLLPAAPIYGEHHE